MLLCIILAAGLIFCLLKEINFTAESWAWAFVWWNFTASAYLTSFFTEFLLVFVGHRVAWHIRVLPTVLPFFRLTSIKIAYKSKKKSAYIHQSLVRLKLKEERSVEEHTLISLSSVPAAKYLPSARPWRVDGLWWWLLRVQGWYTLIGRRVSRTLQTIYGICRYDTGIRCRLWHRQQDPDVLQNIRTSPINRTRHWIQISLCPWFIYYNHCTEKKNTAKRSRGWSWSLGYYYLGTVHQAGPGGSPFPTDSEVRQPNPYDPVIQNDLEILF